MMVCFRLISLYSQEQRTSDQQNDVQGESQEGGDKSESTTTTQEDEKVSWQ